MFFYNYCIVYDNLFSKFTGFIPKIEFFNTTEILLIQEGNFPRTDTMKRQRRGSMIAGVSRKPLTPTKKGGETSTSSTPTKKGGDLSTSRSSCITGVPGEKADRKMGEPLENREASQESQGTEDDRRLFDFT